MLTCRPLICLTRVVDRHTGPHSSCYLFCFLAAGSRVLEVPELVTEAVSAGRFAAFLACGLNCGLRWNLPCPGWDCWPPFLEPLLLKQ